MIDSHCQRLAQFRPPTLCRLILPRIDQIETDPPEGAPSNVEGPPPLGHRMHPTEPLQIAVVQGLHPHRQPVDARLCIGAKPSRPLQTQGWPPASLRCHWPAAMPTAPDPEPFAPAPAPSATAFRPRKTRCSEPGPAFPPPPGQSRSDRRAPIFPDQPPAPRGC